MKSTVTKMIAERLLQKTLELKVKLKVTHNAGVTRLTDQFYLKIYIAS